MNIYEIGHIFFSVDETNLKYSNRKIDNYFANSYFWGTVNFLLKFIYSLIFVRKSFPKIPDEYNGILVYGPSRNNRVSLTPIVEKIGKEKTSLFLEPKFFPSWKLYWYALPHFFDLVREIRKASPRHKRVIKFFFSKFLRMYGCEKVANQMVEKYKPNIIIMANDHLEINRCLLFAAKARNVKTVYIQHASVGTTFPPLQFSYSLLDGLDALEKYRSIGPLSGNIYLCGGLRFDKISDLKKEKETKIKVGVAINLVDTPELVKETCLRLAAMKKIGVEVILRPHPQMQEDSWRHWCKQHGMSYSSPMTESSFDFIKKLTVLIANQCSIHLDAAMCRVPSLVYYMSKDGPSDVYGFVKQGLTCVATNLDEVKEFIDSLDHYVANKQAIRYFNCSYGTSYEGNVSSIMASLISSIQDNDIEHFNSDYSFDITEKGDQYKVYSFKQNEDKSCHGLPNRIDK